MSVHSVEKIKPKKPNVRRLVEQWFYDRSFNHFKKANLKTCFQGASIEWRGLGRENESISRGTRRNTSFSC